MSDVVDKTLNVLPSLLANSLGVDGGKNASGASRGFQSLIKQISNAKSKHEEDQVLQREISLHKQKLAQPNLSSPQKRDSLVRLLYCHMLGQDVSFGCIHAIKLAQQGSLMEKRVGYLVCSLLMDDQHELVTLLVNTMQKDLLSTNILENLASLTAITHLCGPDMVPAMLPLVKDKLSHPRDSVRKKAVLCMHHFLEKAPEMVQNDIGCLKKMLSDRDPSVVWASLQIFCDLIQNNPSAYRDLVPGFLGILGQVIGRKLPTDYDFHTVPAPWMTIVLLRILRKLGAHDQSVSENIYPALKDVLQKTEPSHKMGLAVIFECLQTITQIYPYPELVNHAVGCVGRFLSAKSINLKYLGLKALVSMVTVSPRCTVQHQDMVLDCLEHADITIQKQTLELLYKMAGPRNVKVICSKMLEFMNRSSDKFIRSDIIHKVTELTERFSSDLLWYIQTMNLVVTMAEDCLPPLAADNIIWNISQGCVSRGDESDPLADKQTRAEVCRLYWDLLEQSKLPHTLITVGAWVLAEYSHCVQDITPHQIIQALLRQYNMTFDLSARSQIVASLQKMTYYVSEPHSIVGTLVSAEGGDGSTSASDERFRHQLKQRISELEGLCKANQSLKVAVNPETRPPLSQLDFSLSFLDDYVCDSLEHGASPYKHKALRDTLSAKVSAQSLTSSSLNFAPYQTPLMASRGSSSSRGVEQSVRTPSLSSGGSGSREEREPGLNLRSSKKIWSKEGLIRETSPASSGTPPTQAESVSEPIPHFPTTVEDSPQMTLTPEQQRRNELASALFGSLQAEETILDTMNTELVNISSPNTSEAVFSQPALTESDTLKPPSNIVDSLTLNSSQQYNMCTDPPGGGADPRTPEKPPSVPFGSTLAFCDTSDRQELIDPGSILSPEDQVISGSMYSDFKMVDPHDHSKSGKPFLDGSTNKNSSLDRIRRNLNPESEASSGKMTVSAVDRDSLEVEKTMYDELSASFQSSESDDFVCPPHPGLLDTADDTTNHKTTSDTVAMVTGFTKVPHKDSHPSPWKMLGPRRSNYDESTEDSMSIEVDSIEDDEPPGDFSVESPGPVTIATDTEAQRGSSGMSDVLTVRSLCELEPLPKSEPTVLLKQNNCVLKCQKVFQKDCLVLVLHFTLEQGILSKDGTCNGHVMGSLSSVSNKFFDIKTIMMEKRDALSGVTKDTCTHLIPGTTLVFVKPKNNVLNKISTSLQFSEGLPDTSTNCCFAVEIELADFFRPSITLDVDNFGHLWAKNELFHQSASIQSPQGEGHDSVQGHFQILQDFGFSIVQRIGNEAIFAAQWLDQTSDVVLVHCKNTTRGMLDIAVKGQCMDVVKEIVDTLKHQIQSHR